MLNPFDVFFHLYYIRSTSFCHLYYIRSFFLQSMFLLSFLYIIFVLLFFVIYIIFVRLLPSMLNLPNICPLNQYKRVQGRFTCPKGTPPFGVAWFGFLSARRQRVQPNSRSPGPVYFPERDSDPRRSLVQVPPCPKAERSTDQPVDRHRLTDSIFSPHPTGASSFLFITVRKRWIYLSIYLSIYVQYLCDTFCSFYLRLFVRILTRI
ncbi:unnamed protein product [Acanthosepion pharaonis]|uniref:Uncharacterized protein n=1 Tax=Acanthosepion pharaonis TaxID=158019 RepID=A0A812E798_ACAPH|nr:unnamed protein product [Sepia pharaonis]